MLPTPLEPLVPALVLFSVATALILLFTPLRHRLPWGWWTVPLVAGVALVTWCPAVVALGGATTGLVMGALGMAMALPSVWIVSGIALANQQDDTDGGEDPDGPPPAPQPPMGDIDWEEFDRARESWALPVPYAIAVAGAPRSSSSS